MGSGGTGKVRGERREAAKKEGVWPKHRVAIKVAWVLAQDTRGRPGVWLWGTGGRRWRVKVGEEGNGAGEEQDGAEQDGKVGTGGEEEGRIGRRIGAGTGEQGNGVGSSTTHF